ncbi:hypothetical protein DDB_G0273077 [Dictyostelium discoideum AX4]|uniref:RING-CH-type domain-containing protein n=1 Tax=Dictyostelium discoideum TaxID=44689 RepID=Q556W9_DICDI|nr:hypothetical protein DDB_G0273767 [Dictyostelium discoideum AX4]XP_644750.1 hypothetical protein DDB_G0273077 [Dictyostelium discoideum AX4]EAL70574.1 hypothetical protein DDB_G0273767 [Dictyostelium discoideum AX4]EAL70756.1 hypothetical protein DDB_G0273077 [Dictyostelium discoideum AX4]|eukprot:XP_644500.1 hypothetical protein DDB_G0273767 [Dictyostelium discoideum AX4]
MLIECRFCLEEIEVEDPIYDKKEFNLNENSIKSKDIEIEELEFKEKLNRNSNGGYVELTPISQSKRQRKNIGNRLVRPCDCKGTQRHVHVKCLCEWIGKCNKWYCSICHRVYNLSPHHLHYCVMKLQRKGVLKNLPPIYSNTEFSRSSYFALLIFMGTLSMLMLPSTLPQQNSKIYYGVDTILNNHINNNNNNNGVGSGSGGSGTGGATVNSLLFNNFNGGIISFSNEVSGGGMFMNYNPLVGINGDTTTAGYNPGFLNSPSVSYYSFYPSSSSPSIYISSTGGSSSAAQLNFHQHYNVNSIQSNNNKNKNNNKNDNNDNNNINIKNKGKDLNEKLFESDFDQYFNSDSASIFSSCKLKNQDEKFSSFVCHSSLYSPNVLNSNNNPNNQQQVNFHFPTIVRSSSTSGGGSSNNNDESTDSITSEQLKQQHKVLLKNYNFIHNIENYQPTTPTTTTSTILQNGENRCIDENEQLQQQETEQQQQSKKYKSTSKSPILNNLGSEYHDDIHLQNIYIAHQKYHRVTIADSFKNIFCTLIPVKRFCY